MNRTLRLISLQTILWGSTLIFTPELFARVEPDSTKVTDLKEVVVKGDNQYVTAEKSVFIPDARQKKAARDAVDLIRRMGIPQISVSPQGGVTAMNGEEVSIFIDYMPAAPGELNGMRTADVSKVEYLDAPTDVRFQGAKRVINFIMHKYLWGGYTKLSDGATLLNYRGNNASVFSKFNYKKTTFDLYFGENYNNQGHSGAYTRETYRVKDVSGILTDIDRTAVTEASKSISNSIPVSLRIAYNKEGMSILNTFGYTFSTTPHDYSRGSLSFTPAISKADAFETEAANRSRSISWNGNYYFGLPSQWSLSVVPMFYYTHNNSGSLYRTLPADGWEGIRTDAREDAYNGRFNVALAKQIKKHTVSLKLDGGLHSNFVRYSGNSSFTNRFHNPFWSFWLMWNYSVNKWRFNVDGGYIQEWTKISDHTVKDFYPFAHANIVYSPTSKSQFSFWFQYASATSGIAGKTPEAIQSNELLWISGNPDLKGSRHTTFMLSYLWMPTNNLYVNLYANNFTYYNAMSTVYSPYLDGHAILRTSINSGNENNFTLSGSVTWRPLGGKLQLQLRPMYYFYSYTLSGRKRGTFALKANASYYMGNFYVSGYFQLGTKTQTGPYELFRSKNWYTLEAGWSNGDWNLSASISNLHRSGWGSYITDLDTDYYKSWSQGINVTFHRQLELSASYTFGYGKKIQRGNEIGGQGSAGSAILR